MLFSPARLPTYGASGPVVSTASGRIEGTVELDVERFLGIPFARASVGGASLEAARTSGRVGRASVRRLPHTWVALRLSQVMGLRATQKIASTSTPTVPLEQGRRRAPAGSGVLSRRRQWMGCP
jgi:hypothetical protein